jgi:hypothetical protein
MNEVHYTHHEDPSHQVGLALHAILHLVREWQHDACEEQGEVPEYALVLIDPHLLDFPGVIWPIF